MVSSNALDRACYSRNPCPVSSLETIGSNRFCSLDITYYATSYHFVRLYLYLVVDV
jgi:hypothetical protein